MIVRGVIACGYRSIGKGYRVMMLAAITRREESQAGSRPTHWSESLADSPAPIKFDEIGANLKGRVSKYGAPLDRPTQRPITDPDIIKMVRGRPTEYKPEFCQLVQEDALAGFSLSAFAGKIGVDPFTLQRWTLAHPDFSEAVARAKALRLRDWESDAITVRQTGGTGSQATMIIFGLKNMGVDDWKEKQEVAHSGNISLSSLIGDSMKTIDHEPELIEQSPVVDG